MRRLACLRLSRVDFVVACEALLAEWCALAAIACGAFGSLAVIGALRGQPHAARVAQLTAHSVPLGCCSPFLHLGFPAVVFTYVKGTPMYGLKTESSFDAAHFLTDYHGKCENLHGHRWRVVAYLEQEELQTQGTHKDMVIDFADFKGALRDLTEAFDHSFVVEEGSLAPDTLACLEREGFSLSIVPFRTTAENLARYFYGKLADAGFPVSQVDVYETPNNCAIYRG